MRLARSFAAALMLALPAALGAQSQSTASVRGTVSVDGQGPASGVQIVVTHTQTGIERFAVTNADGRFLILLLTPGGPYSLTVTSLGYADTTRDGIQLQVGETHTADIVLSEEAIALRGIDVNVERAEIFNPGQVGPATLLNEELVQSIPVLSRDIMELANLSPLVKTTENGGFSVAGQNDRYNQVLVDGVANKDAFGLTAGGVPGGQAGAKVLPLDAVAQYEILVAPFDVRLSGFAGGVMNAVTKTGTNEWYLRGFGVGRDAALMGDLSLPTGVVRASGVDRSLFGFSAGGPLVVDRAHFFVSAEFERRRQHPSGFNVGRDAPAVVQIAPSATAGLDSLLLEQFGLETGIAGPYGLDQELANIFTRVDATLSPAHRLTVRNVYAGAANDEAPNRAAFEPYGLSSNAVFRRSVSNTTSLQLFSDTDFGGNELEIAVQRSVDETAPAVAWPQVEVELFSKVGDLQYSRAARAGAQFFAQDNDLEQTTVRALNTVTLASAGGSTYTVGLTAALHDVRHRYLPGAMGDWFFASPTDLANNAPQRAQRSRLLPGNDDAVGFSVLETGVYVQDEIDAGKGLTMRFGLRADFPTVLDQPQRNDRFLGLFGYDTSALPSGQILLSPRWGFNWQSDGERTTQVRGGAGFFTGQLPYVWLSNAFHYTGLRSVTDVCVGRHTDDPRTGNTAPMFDPVSPALACLAGAPISVSPVTVFDPDFKYPRYIKFSAIVDHELTDRMSGSLGFLFSMARNQVVVEELNLGRPAGQLGPTEGFGGTERRYYGRPSPDGFDANRDHPEFDQSLLVTNGGQDWTYSLTGELRGRLSDRVAFQLGYAYARSFDKMSLASVDMVSNYGFNPTAFDPNNPRLRPSNFDRPHKFVAAVYGAPIPRLDTEISLLYTGQSGLPFSYVYRADLNGDGYPDVGPAFDRNNDLLYVPNTAGEVPAGFATTALLASALERDECLSEHRGEILPRNACRAPWQHRLDLRVTHPLRVRGAEVRIEADMINVLNFINDDWGTLNSIRTVVPLLEADRSNSSLGGVPPLFARWAAGALPGRDADGNLVSPDPWSALTPDSQWQGQLGLRVTFGARR